MANENHLLMNFDVRLVRNITCCVPPEKIHVAEHLLNYRENQMYIAPDELFGKI